MSANLAAGAARWPTSEDYVSRARRIPVLVGALALALASAYAAALIVTDGDRLLLVPLVGAVVVLVILAHPVVGVYVLFGAALLFEQFPIAQVDPITAQTHIFQNISSFTPVPVRLSLAELLMLLTLGSWAARRVAGTITAFRMGPIGWPVAAYASVFVIGAVIGAARGGSWSPDAALAEMRAPLYVCLMYFLAANLIRDRRQVAVLLWAFVLMIGIKAVQGILNYQGSTDLGIAEAVTSHEDVVFFDVAIALAVLAIVLGVRTKLTYVLLGLQPVVLLAELLTQRRVGFVALGAVLVVVTLLALAANPRRGMVLAAVGALAIGAYVVAFWENSGAIGEPIRALRGVLDPSSVSLRDQLSNGWRDIENRNIAYTIQQVPLTGVGVGQKYFFRQQPPPLPDSFTFWRYITHNAVLWLWLKAGPLGGFVLWFLVGRVLILGSALFVRLRDPSLRWVAAFPITLIACQIVFSSVDLGLTYSRTMIVLGVALGLPALLFDANPLVSASRREEPA